MGLSYTLETATKQKEKYFKSTETGYTTADLITEMLDPNTGTIPLLMSRDWLCSNAAST